MKKKILFVLLFSLFGVAFSIWAELFLRNQTHNLYRWTTNNKIHFVGKNIYFFAHPLYYISFGIWFTLNSFYSNIKSSLKSLLLSITIFIVFTIIVAFIDGNLRVIVCTACDDGILKLHYNSVNFGLILGISALLSLTPVIFKLIKLKK
tara:strand:+ start:114875 stop:115321 length:447 start_codon:yes stop_codon:yes gene_type:complete